MAFIFSGYVTRTTQMGMFASSLFCRKRPKVGEQCLSVLNGDLCKVATVISVSGSQGFRGVHEQRIGIDSN